MSFLQNLGAGGFTATGALNNILGLQQLADQQQLRARQQEAERAALNQKNALANLVRLETGMAQGLDPVQLSGLLQENIARAQQAGGDPVDSMRALEILQAQGPEALGRLLQRGRAVAEMEGLLEPLQMAAGPEKGTFTIKDGRVLNTKTGQVENLIPTELERINEQAKTTQDKTKIAKDLRAEVNKISKDMGVIPMFSAYNKLKTSNTGTPAGDLSLIYGYMKMLDPNSTVMEGEIANASNTTGAAGMVTGLYNRIRSGEKLTQAQRDQFISEAENLYRANKSAFDKVAQPVLNIGKNQGLSQNDILGEGYFESFSLPEITQPEAPQVQASTQQVPGMLARPEPIQAVTAGEYVAPSGISYTVEVN